VTNKDGESKVYELGISEVLRQNGNVCDEYILENGIARVIRRINEDGTIKSNEETEDLGEFVIELNEGINTITIQNYIARLKAKFAIKNDYTNIFATNAEARALIQHSADEINSRVSKKVDEDEVFSVINQSAGKVKIKAENIEMEGLTTFNKNVEITEEGILRCIKAICEDIEIRNSTIREGSIHLKSSNEAVSFSVSDTSNDRINSELSAMLLNFNSNQIRNALQMGIIQNTGNGFVSIEGDIDCYNLHQWSLAEKKKNIEKLDNALDLVMKSDVYTYNFKTEKDGAKKHIGLVIGDGYNIADEVVSEDGKSIESYSMNSTLWRAVQQQQEQIDEMQKEIKKLKEEK